MIKNRMFPLRLEMFLLAQSVATPFNMEMYNSATENNPQDNHSRPFQALGSRVWSLRLCRFEYFFKEGYG